jgi:hypothetical protein
MELPAWSFILRLTVIGVDVSAGSITCTAQLSCNSQLRSVLKISIAIAPFGAGSWGHVGPSQSAKLFDPQRSMVKTAHERPIERCPIVPTTCSRDIANPRPGTDPPPSLATQARTCTGDDAPARIGFKRKLTPEEAPSAVHLRVPERIIVSARRIAGTRTKRYQRRLRARWRFGSGRISPESESESIRTGSLLRSQRRLDQRGTTTSPLPSPRSPCAPFWPEGLFGDWSAELERSNGPLRAAFVPSPSASPDHRPRRLVLLQVDQSSAKVNIGGCWSDG